MASKKSDTSKKKTGGKSKSLRSAGDGERRQEPSQRAEAEAGGKREREPASGKGGKAREASPRRAGTSRGTSQQTSLGASLGTSLGHGSDAGGLEALIAAQQAMLEPMKVALAQTQRLIESHEAALNDALRRMTGQGEDEGLNGGEHAGPDVAKDDGRNGTGDTERATGRDRDSGQERDKDRAEVARHGLGTTMGEGAGSVVSAMPGFAMPGFAAPGLGGNGRQDPFSLSPTAAQAAFAPAGGMALAGMKAWADQLQRTQAFWTNVAGMWLGAAGGFGAGRGGSANTGRSGDDR